VGGCKKTLKNTKNWCIFTKKARAFTKKGRIFTKKYEKICVFFLPILPNRYNLTPRTLFSTQNPHLSVKSVVEFSVIFGFYF